MRAARRPPPSGRRGSRRQRRRRIHRPGSGQVRPRPRFERWRRRSTSPRPTTSTTTPGSPPALSRPGCRCRSARQPDISRRRFAPITAASRWRTMRPAPPISRPCTDGCIGSSRTRTPAVWRFVWLKGRVIEQDAWPWMAPRAVEAEAPGVASTRPLYRRRAGCATRPGQSSSSVSATVRRARTRLTAARSRPLRRARFPLGSYQASCAPCAARP